MQADRPLSLSPVSSLSESAAVSFRRAEARDFSALLDLELSCFEPGRRDGPATIRRSLANPRHEVWVMDERNATPGELAGALFLRRKGRTLRLHSLAVHPDRQGGVAGRRLLALACRRATETGVHRLVLEVDAARPQLVAWYARHGFRKSRLLPDYYGEGREAWRMERCLSPGFPGS